MRVLIVSGSLAMGGAEKQASLLAAALLESGYEVALLTFSNGANDFFTLPASVVRYSGREIGMTPRSWHSPLTINLMRQVTLRKAIRRFHPDYILGFGETCSVHCLLAAMPSRLSKVLAYEQTDPSKHKVSRWVEVARRYLYRFSKAVVVQRDDILGYFTDFVPRSKIVCIPNIIAGQSHVEFREGRLFDDRLALIYVGRLEQVKQIHLALAAVAELGAMGISVKLTIVGEGSERARLEALARSMRLTMQVDFVGAVADPSALLAQSDVFILPSIYEGLPNALLEATMAGLPVVGFRSALENCPVPSDHMVLVEEMNGASLAAALNDMVMDRAHFSCLRNAAARARETLTANSPHLLWRALLSK